ncbi:MAG: 23S rRNA (pseudouridine(1915)-N(3))-methyltransferase RlmH [Solirubrobacterales bacterium]|nr:23S rRNA (pseudouridine(1915)-N(3))-methyltransferase RlmH [Solirubrobacterales bacterium]
MKTTVVAFGRGSSPFSEAEVHYVKLLSRRQPVEVIAVKDDAELLRRIPAGGDLIALDRGGRRLDSLAWSRWLDERRLAARDLCFAIGGPQGLPAEVLEDSRERLSLGPQTMAHQLARVVLLEQLFRAVKILAGEPYHC